jgi:predicted NUDIX family phosphoesterase/dephospho-CoA kinase/DNA-directed RNA polymerase delta subunit
MDKRENISQADAAYIVLKDIGAPLSLDEIVREIQKRGLIEFTNFKDLKKAIRGRIGENIRRLGRESRFLRVEPGIYTTRKFPDFSYIEAITFVLAYVGIPLSASEIVKKIIDYDLIEISAKSPTSIIHARISQEIKKNGERSNFKRVSSGRYTLRRFPGKEFFPRPWKRKISKPDKLLGTDRVLVFDSSLLNKVGYFHGINKDYQKYANVLLSNNNSFYIDRMEAEKTTKYKQIVSYIIVKFQDQLLRFVRGNIETTKTYLFGNYSIGFGGHIQESDLNLFSLSDNDMGYTWSISRELFEEVGIHSLEGVSKQSRIIGVLTDDSSKLGESHFAFIHFIELSSPAIKKNEYKIKDLSFVNISDISKEFGAYEYWSKLCLISYYNDLLNIRCHIQSSKNSKLTRDSEIILLAGLISSGKTEVGELFAKEFGYTLIRCSEILKEILGYKPSDSVSRISMQNEGLKFISSNEGHNDFAKKIVAFIKKAPGKKIILDGLRYRESLVAVEELLGKKIPVIYIDSMDENLYQNYLEREKTRISFQDFLKIINHPVEREIEKFRYIADLEIYNYGSIISLLNNVKAYYYNEI